MRSPVVYRVFSADDRLLYVGCSMDPLRRVYQHGKAVFASEAARIELEHFDTRDAAYAAESVAIRGENPIYNVRRDPRAPASEDELRERREAREKSKAESQARWEEIEATSFMPRGVNCANCGERPGRLPKGSVISETGCPTCGVAALQRKEVAA